MSTSLMTLDQVAQWLAHSGHTASLPPAVHGDAATPLLRVHTDTRSIANGDLFVALQGETFDANTLLHQAQAQGAAAVLCRSGLAAGRAAGTRAAGPREFLERVERLSWQV